jgi:hypothetical protein
VPLGQLRGARSGDRAATPTPGSGPATSAPTHGCAAS